MSGEPYVYGDEVDPYVWINIDGRRVRLDVRQAQKLADELSRVAAVMMSSPPVSLTLAMTDVSVGT